MPYRGRQKLSLLASKGVSAPISVTKPGRFRVSKARASYKVRHRDAQGIGDAEDQHDTRILAASFNAAQVRTVYPCSMRQFFLRHALSIARALDRRPQRLQGRVSSVPRRG